MSLSTALHLTRLATFSAGVGHSPCMTVHVSKCDGLFVLLGFLDADQVLWHRAALY